MAGVDGSGGRQALAQAALGRHWQGRNVHKLSCTLRLEVRQPCSAPSTRAPEQCTSTGPSPARACRSAHKRSSGSGERGTPWSGQAA